MPKSRRIDVSEDADLREQVRSSVFHPDDPDYLKLAWQDYHDTAHGDRKRQDAARAAEGKKPLAKVRYSWESELAIRRYWDAVKAAHDAGYEALNKLDTNSKRVSVLPPDDDKGDADDD